jgi:hypothetical protein
VENLLVVSKREKALQNSSIKTTLRPAVEAILGFPCNAEIFLKAVEPAC